MSITMLGGTVQLIEQIELVITPVEQIEFPGEEEIEEGTMLLVNAPMIGGVAGQYQIGDRLLYKNPPMPTQLGLRVVLPLPINATTYTVQKVALPPS